MKSLKTTLAAATLIMAVSVSVFAGDIHTPGATPPPPPPPSESCIAAAETPDDLSGSGVMQISRLALNLVLAALSLR